MRSGQSEVHWTKPRAPTFCHFVLAAPSPLVARMHPSLNPKLMGVGWFQTMSLPEGRCSCAASSFSFCCYGHCRCRAQQAPPRFLFMARSTRSTTEYAPSRPPHPNMALSRAAGGAAITIRKLTSAKDRQICVKSLSWRPYFPYSMQRGFLSPTGRPNGPPRGRRWGRTAGRQPGVSLEVATDNQGTIREPKNFSFARLSFRHAV